MWGGRWTIFPDISLLLFKLYRQTGHYILVVESTGKYTNHYSKIDRKLYTGRRKDGNSTEAEVRM
jgi:hypothetical protein